MTDSSPIEVTEREYLSPHEFVARSGLSLPTVRRYLRDGRLPSIQPGGRRCRVLIPRSALESYSAAKSAARTSDTNRAPIVATPSESRHKTLPGPRAKWRSQN